MTMNQIIESTGAYACFACGKCTSRCPLAQASALFGEDGSFSPRSVVVKALEENVDSEDSLVWSCLTCGACRVGCPSDVDFPRFIRDLRANLIKTDGQAELPLCSAGRQLSSVASLMAKKDLTQERMGWTEGLKVTETGDTLYFAGCLPYFDVVFDGVAETTSIAQSAVKVMNACGIEPVVLPQEVCCGHDKLWLGHEATFKQLAQKNIDMIRATGAKRIVTSCPECYRTLKLDYPDHFDFDVEVLHTTEFISEQIAEGRLRWKESGTGEARKATYQDPCRLGKHMGVYEQPREILKGMPGIEFEEMSQVRSESACCGTSAFSGCDKLREQIRINRLSEAKDMLVTACPKCLIHFSCTKNKNQVIDPALSGVEIKDLTTLVAENLEFAPVNQPEPAQPVAAGL